MSKKSYKVIKFITETMKNWKVELRAWGKTLAELKIQRGIFLWDALSPLLFVIVMMLLNHTLRKCAGHCKFTKLQEKINHFIYMDGIKLFAKNEKKNAVLNTKK